MHAVQCRGRELGRGYYSTRGWSFGLCRGDVEVGRPGRAVKGAITLEVISLMDGIAYE